MNYILMSDSTSDLPSDVIEKIGISIIPFNFAIDNVPYSHYPDEREMSSKEFYERLRQGAMPVTSQVNPKTYMEYFNPILEQGKDILYICFTTGLSGSYQSANIAADELSEKYPDRRIEVVDSLAASVGEGVLIYNAAIHYQNGMSLDELKNWVLENRLKARHWFMVEDLFHLKRGGRISGVEAVIGTALKIHPILSVDHEGKLVVRSKARGLNKAIEYILSKVEEEGVDLSEQTLVIGHADCIDRAEKIKEELIARGIGKDYIVSTIGPVIGTHVGSGMIAVTFMGKESVTNA